MHENMPKPCRAIPLKMRNKFESFESQNRIDSTNYSQVDPMKYSKYMLPCFYAITIFVNLFSIFYSGAPMLGAKDFSLSYIILISSILAAIVWVGIFFFYIPKITKDVEQLVEGPWKFWF